MRATKGTGGFHRNKSRPLSPWRYRVRGVEIDGVKQASVDAYGRTRNEAKKKVEEKIAAMETEAERQKKIKALTSQNRMAASELLGPARRLGRR